MTLAEYAHRGAYTLIATAILAGAFVLVALAPSSAAVGSRTVQRLLLLWIAQSLLLVASSILRLFDYIAAYPRSRLFEAFYTTRRASGGTGLGLTIARSMLEAHGGSIVLLNRAAGAWFAITLPV